MIKLEQKRREEDSETPFEKTWFFRLQKLVWAIKHKQRCGYNPTDVVSAYLGAIEALYAKSEAFQEDTFSVVGLNLRLAGATLIINEVWSINHCDSGIYVHKRASKDADWDIVYRTYWLMDDMSFIRLLLNARSLACVAVPPVVISREDNAGNLTSEAAVH